MATRKVSLELRRLCCRRYHSLQSPLISNPNFPARQFNTPLTFPFTTSFRYFSSAPSDPHLFTDASGISDPDFVSVLGGGDYILPIRPATSLLDWVHHTTGLPWWITIASSAVMLRVSLFPFLLFQLHKLKRIGECIPKLPPPFPPPFSGESYAEHFRNFRRERRNMDCPSLLWVLAYASVQAPSFLLLMGTIRQMSLDHYTGFGTGGILWFHNLTELGHGPSAFIFPTLIASLHLLNVQISFKSSRVGKKTDMFDSLAKYYGFGLKALTVPIFVTGFLVPHGSLVYWVSNSSLNLIQHLCLQNSAIREKLGLAHKQAVISVSDPGSGTTEALSSKRKVPVKDLSPKELVGLSVLSLSRGNKDRALPFLRLALDKDPEYVRALTVMGQTLLQKGQEVEAVDYFERAVAKLSCTGLPTEAEDVDLLIQASQWAGVAYIRQGKLVEGRVHLERVTSVKEPEDANIKVRYYDGLVLLASTYLNEGRKAEAIQYLEKAAAFNPEYNDYLEQCKKDVGDFSDDLVNSRSRKR